MRRGRELAVRPHAQAFLLDAATQILKSLRRQRLQALYKGHGALEKDADNATDDASRNAAAAGDGRDAHCITGFATRSGGARTRPMADSNSHERPAQRHSHVSL